MRRLLCLAMVASALVVAPVGTNPAPAGAQETPPPVIEVPPGGDIQAAAAAGGPGAILQLQGAYTVTSTISPLDGQTFRGPATLVGQGVQFVFNNAGSGVTYEWLDISGATGTRASAIQLGVGGTVRNSVLHDNGWNGVRGQYHDGPANITLEDVELYGNGFDPASMDTGGGGYKFLNGDGLTTLRVYSHDNVGNGGWLDQDWRSFTSTDDVYVRNSVKGLFYEVSLGPALIERTTARDNGSAGIQVNSSEHVVVRDAVLGGNGNARGVVAADISAKRTDRYSRPPLDVVFEVDTFALNGDNVVGCAITGVTCSPKISVGFAGDGTGRVTSTPAGIDCTTACSAWFPIGSSVVLDAWPDPGSEFVGWEGACTGTDPCQLTPTAATSVTATFRRTPRTLTVSNAGAGSVTSDPVGIDCGATCAASFPHGSTITLAALPAPGNVFVGWGGACSGSGSCVITLDTDLQVTATFVPGPRPLDVTVVGDGRVTSSPAGIDCGVLCIASFPDGTQVALTASAGTGQAFVGWGGACSGTGGCSVTMDQARSVTATFSPLPRQLSVSKAGTGTVTSSPAGIDCGPTCSASFAHGTVVTLAATPGAGQVFAGWSGACSGTGTCQVTMDADRSATATFAPAPTTTTTLADTDAAVRYQGWAGVTEPGASGGTYRVSSTKNETATWVSASATSVTWIARTGPDRGKASVTIDGVGKGTFDLYAASPGSSSVTFAGLASGSHTVVVKVLGTKRSASSGTGVTVDAFVAGGVTVQDTSAQIAYVSWAGVAEPAATDGAARRSATKNATATVTFTGTRIDWITAVGTGYGKATVTIDGVGMGTFDLYAAADAWQQTRTFGGLAPGTHTMTIKVLGQKRAASTGTAIVVDGFVVHP